MNTFLPAIFGETLLLQDKGLFALPIREDGFSIEELSVKRPKEYEISKKSPDFSNNHKVTLSQTLIIYAKLEKAWELQERSKQAEEALPIPTS